MTNTDVVTGAFSYSGRAIARQLISDGRQVRTLTGHPERAPDGSAIEIHRMNFTDPIALTDAMRGADTLYNTYWVRFAHGAVDHQRAVSNSRILFEAAARAGIRRIVHVSITNPRLDSPFPYFRGKAEVERALADLGVSYAIARPAILFGGDGVLISNVAWLLRYLPVFAIGGSGDYRVRGIHIADLARLCAQLSIGSDPVIVDAVGPETLTFGELVRAVRTAVGSHALIVPVPGPVLPILSRVLGVFLRDQLLTADEYRAMAAGLADSTAPATGQVVLSEWIARHGAELGRSYVNELRRHFQPVPVAVAGGQR